MTPRTVCWFSAGAPSAVAAKLTLAHADPDVEVVVAYTDPGSEHEDNHRFIADVEKWLGVPVLKLKSDKYRDTWHVWEETRYLVGVAGARCTAELKRKVRFNFERPTDRQVFGFTYDEKHRVDRFREQNPGVDLVTPLIDAQLSKADCLGIIERAGIELPIMYRLGFSNSNCVGCCKANSFKYWNRMRVHFPETFERMSAVERDIGHSILSEEVTPGTRKKTPVWLDELDPNRGDIGPEVIPECSLLCVLAEDEIQNPT